jgi:cell wall-associated NlpC family hydrolase
MTTLSTTIRRSVLAAAIVAAGVSTLAAPSLVHAAPAAVISVSPPVPVPVAPASSDAVAQLAADALARLNRAGTRPGDAFSDQLDRVANATALRLNLEPARLRAAWQAADVDHQRALLAALTQLGTPYRKNTSKPGIGFDCSGLTTYAWGVAGVELPRQSSAQIRGAAKRDALTAQAGDLVQYPGHVMMWLGVDRAVIHAVGRGRSVELDHTKARRSLRFGDPTA